ncbi:MAG TPA: quinolinate synthase NadA, partial [Candidatus Brocadiia bacterium]|nr:quinolinate synthase NadA [Candidatus Brocadiia bacterium]
MLVGHSQGGLYAVKVLKAVPAGRRVLFVPDRSLGEYAARKAGRDVILWPGYCPTHHRILATDIQRARQEHPDALVVVHPECLTEVVDAADHVASTTGILKFCHDSPAREFVIGTEIGLLHRLAKENPEKRFFAASVLSDCPNMKLNTLEKMVWSLEDMEFRVTVAPDVAAKAKRAIARMLELA